MKRIVLICSLIGLTTFAVAQPPVKGGVLICYGFQFPSGGYLALRYYPSETISVEVYSSAFPNIFNYGARANFFAKKPLPNEFLSIGFSSMSLYNPALAYEPEQRDSVLFIGSFFHGIDLGIGRDVPFGDARISFQLGPTYVFNAEDRYFNGKREVVRTESMITWSSFLVGAVVAPVPR